ncbi:MAG: hypothetical protein HQK83_13975 [Fibrobacteria bacterium]|nr:hypothetical protein [Fibrobacteria bacterium]
MNTNDYYTPSFNCLPERTINWLFVMFFTKAFPAFCIALVLCQTYSWGQPVDRFPSLKNYFIDEDGQLLLLFTKKMDIDAPLEVTPKKLSVTTVWKSETLLELNGKITERAEHGLLQLKVEGLRDREGNAPVMPVVVGINIDKEAPYITSHNLILENGGRLFNKENITLTIGNLEEESGIANYQLKLDSLPTLAINDSVFALEKLSDGTHQLAVWVTDKSGNISDTAITSFRTDLTFPAVDSVFIKPGGDATLIRLIVQFSERLDTSHTPVIELDTYKTKSGGWRDSLTVERLVYLNPSAKTGKVKLVLKGFSDPAGNNVEWFDTTVTVPLALMLNYADLMEKNAKWERSLKIYQALKLQYPMNTDVRRRCVSLYQKQLNLAGEQKELKQIAGITPYDTAVFERLSDISLKHGKGGGSRVYLNQLLRLRGRAAIEENKDYQQEGFAGFHILSDNYLTPKSDMNPYAAAFIQAGIDLASQQKYSEALCELEKAREFNRGDLVDYNYAVILNESGNEKDVDPLLETIKGDNSSINQGIAAILASQGKFDEALSRYSNIENHNTLAEHKSNLGVLLFKQEKRQKGFELIKKAALISDDPRVTINYAYALYLSGKYTNALSVYDRLAEANGQKYPDIYVGRGKCYLALGKKPEAILDFQQAVAMAPYYVDAVLRIGKFQTEEGQWEASKNNLEYVLRLDPESHGANNLLAGIYQALGDKERANKSALKAFKNKKEQNIKSPDAPAAAVLAFRNHSRDSTSSWISIAAAEAISADMQEYSSYKMIDRLQIMKAMEALEFSNIIQGNEDDNEIDKKIKSDIYPQLNNLVSIQKIIVGSFQFAGRNIRFDARILDMESGKIEKSASVTGPVKDIGKLEREIAMVLAGLKYAESLNGLDDPPSLEAQKKLAEARKAQSQGDEKAAQQLSAEALAMDPNILRIMDEAVLVGEDDASGKSLAVLPFTNITGDKEYNWVSLGIQEALITDLKMANLYMVERAQIQQIMQEQDFSQSDMVNDSTGPKIGALVSAGVIITGSYQLIDDIIKINTRMVSVENGEVKLATTIDGKKNDVLTLESKLALKIMEALKINLDNHTLSRIADKPPMALKTLKDNMQKEVDMASLQAMSDKLTGNVSDDVREKLTEKARNALLARKWDHLTDLDAVQAILDSNNLNYVVPQEVAKMDRNERVIKLDISEQDMRVLPAEIGRLQKLKTLILEKNNLKVLPPEIGQLQSLKKLELGRNQLVALPPEIGWMSSLETLELQRNNIEQIPKQIIKLKKLTNINLNFNRLKSLPVEFGSMPHIKSLNASRNEIASIPDQVLKMTGFVFLSNNRLCNLPDKTDAWITKQSKTDKWKMTQRCELEEMSVE